MGRTRFTHNDTREEHQVRCAACGKRETISVPTGGLAKDKRFNTRHEYRCPSCRKAGGGRLF